MLYLSGPYRGHEFANIVQAWATAQRLWLAGHVVFCPHLNTMGMYGADFIAGGLEILGRLGPDDGIYMMKGWESSTGAQMELRQAREQGLQVYIEGENEP